MLANLSLEQALIKAKFHIKKGNFAEAGELYETILKNFSNNIRAQQGLATLNKYKQDSVIQNPPQESLNQLVNLYNQGQISAVIEQAEALTAQYPGAYVVWNILGASRAQVGMLDEAVEAYKKSISLKPDFANAYYNMGVAFQAQGRFDMSIIAYNKVVLFKPDYAEAYNNMGVALKAQGKLDEAIETFNKLIKLKPDHIEAYNNISIILKDIIFNKPNPSLYSTLVSLLNQKSSVRPRNIAKSIISLLKLDQTLNFYLRNIRNDQVKFSIKKVISDLSNLPLLLNLMSVCPITDIELECLLRKIRESLLTEVTYLSKTPELLKFQSALALQCFTNEYIYNNSEYEDKALEDLDELVKLTLNNNEQPKPQFILCLASYKPLNHYEWYDQLDVSNEIKDVFIRQVIEPKQEAELKSELPLLKKINNKISSKVRTQYEFNPYPRWVKLGLPTGHNFSEIIDNKNLKLFDNKIREVKDPKILIAGCGTGQHSIETAAKIKDSTVVAIDLSLSSLAYAKRKTKELDIQNIEYIQADILDLIKLGKDFDLIESMGVLHHMEDPIAGWRVLTNCLKPGGLMKIGLYSELGRQDIVKLREEIFNTGIGSKDFEMKLFRLNMINSQKNNYKQILNSNDFFSLSEFRDLLFHVQEHRFTIPQIKECLLNLGLKFCGFETENLISQFMLDNINKEDSYNLEKWHVFEEANPRVFAGMYQFWCQKI